MEVPKDCMLVFHGLLFHYGGRARWNSTEFKKDLRSFVYLRNESWDADTRPYTYWLPHSGVCDGCDERTDVSNMLKTERCNGDDDMVWRTKLSPNALFVLEAGTVVRGDVHGLGWVVLKRTKVEDPVGFVMEKKDSSF